MEITPELKKIITKLINSSNLPFYPSPKDIPNGENVLPLYQNGPGWYGITLDGEVIWVESNKPYKLEKEEDPLLINVALLQGIKQYPELSPLTPVRKENDITCSSCNGTGKHPLADEFNIICHCGGSGWIPNQKND